MWIVFLALALLVTRGSAAPWNKRMDIDIARCRAKCVTKFVPVAPTNSKCEENECKACWKSCYYIYKEYDAWKEICAIKVLCGKGCRHACKIHGTAIDATNPMNAKFPTSPKITVVPVKKKYRYFLSWNEPVFKDGKKVPASTIYHLLRRNWKFERGDKNSWQTIAQTISPYLQPFDLKPRGSQPETFRLIALSEQGKLAEVIFKSETAPANVTLAGPTYNISKENPAGNATAPPLVVVLPHPTKALRPKVKVTKSMKVQNGSLHLTITWTPTADSYEVTWGLETCNLNKNPSVPHCGQVPDTHSSIVYKRNDEKKKTYYLDDILFNSKYFVDVVPLGSTSKYGMTRLNITTPFCDNVDPTFLICLEGGERVQPWILRHTIRYNATIFRDQAVVSWDNPYNYTGLYLVLRWRYSYSDSNDTKLNSWQESIGAKFTTDGNFTTATPSHVFDLKPYSYYMIEVRTDDEVNIGGGKPRLLYSEVLRFNTTNTTDASHNRRAAPSMGNVQPVHKDKVHSGPNVIMIAVVSAGCIFILIVVIVVYRKCRSGVAIEKTVVANSNSYKSAFGEGKNREGMDPLFTVRDEWELDHCDIKFGNVLGQGAFGKVMTGVYDDQRVAIKVLKDNAPLSYREDFVAEITLMKKLGVHPHIVTLIGACTIVEPLALVLEYMPHGNLQNFLKKCRMDGYIHENEDGRQELEYTETTEGGNDVTWKITSSDMLSFARQVAIAMEYIAERHFVHRDLAARNILVGADKLVKLCDFGLSRDVYGTFEYHKTTGGKLPLKWMAIESLRDRIFTIQSDVWSFGILLWEIVTMGGSPYPSVALADLYVLLCNGYRMEQPSNCSKEVFEIMYRCWADDPADRPSFTDLRESLEILLGKELNYLQLDNIDVPIQPASNSSGFTPPGCLTAENLELIPFADTDFETTPLTKGESMEEVTLQDGNLEHLSCSEASGYLEAKPSGYLEAKPILNGFKKGLLRDLV